MARDLHPPIIPIYSTLQDVNEIRLLHLHPGRLSDPIICRLEHVNFFHKPQYEALSYMWGSEDSPSQIELNGTILDVRNNLWQALSHLCLPIRTRLLWIDALCINQKDFKERNYEVSQMGNIYKNADRVVAWLGQPDESRRVVIEYILSFNPPLSHYDEKHRCVYRHPIVMDGKTMGALSSFCSQEYWTRLWIIQEILLASRVTILCGMWAFEWTELSIFLRVARVHPVMQQDSDPDDKTMWKTDPRFLKVIKSQPMSMCNGRFWGNMVRDQGDGVELPLGEWCLEYSSPKCTDRRDKIFGMSALTPDCCRNTVQVDYSSTIIELFLRLLSHCQFSHPGPESDYGSLARRAEKLYRALGVTQKDLEGIPLSSGPIDSETGMIIKNSPTAFFAHFTGRLSYASGPWEITGTKGM
jgi:Heterokaryon incompatibility protein (HET)